MGTLDIRLFGDPVLRQEAREVTDFDHRLARLAADMHETMQAAEGVGLAANQVGILKRLLTWGVGTEDDEHGSVVNPVLLDASEEAAGGRRGLPVLPRPVLPARSPPARRGERVRDLAR